MTTAEIISVAAARQPSDETTDPPRIALVPVLREELLAALTPKAKKNSRAADLLIGVTNSAAGSLLFCQREHLLEALADEQPADI